MLYAVLTILALLLFSLFLLALQKVRHSGDRFGFIYLWGGVFGAFVWEDLLIFSVFWLGVCLATLLTTDLRIGLLLALVFWVVRSAGETLYYFLQQFLEPTHSPHDIKCQLSVLSALFGEICPQKRYILMQVSFQVLTVVSITCLVLLLTRWQTVPKWIAA